MLGSILTNSIRIRMFGDDQEGDGRWEMGNQTLHGLQANIGLAEGSVQQTTTPMNHLLAVESAVMVPMRDSEIGR